MVPEVIPMFETHNKKHTSLTYTEEAIMNISDSLERQIEYERAARTT